MARRAVLRLLVCLALGAALSVAVAWGCKLYYWRFGSAPTSFTATDRHGSWSVTAWLAPGRRSYTLVPIITRGLPVSPRYVVDGFIAKVGEGDLALAAAYATRLLAERSPGELALTIDSDARLAARFAAALTSFERDTRVGPTGRQLRAAYARSRASLRSFGWYRPTLPTWVRRPVDRPPMDQLATGAYGWPVVCMKAELEITGGPTGVGGGRRYLGSLVIDETNQPRGMICSVPLMPVWHGLAINAALYGAAFATVLLLLPQARRRRRLHAGLCPFCRYDLKYQFGAGCPECGWGRARAVNPPGAAQRPGVAIEVKQPAADSPAREDVDIEGPVSRA